ncbi:MAG: hypothetical protein SFW36_03600 [Leptolyngbyaceae cyanobacterium bins.59]|nr:hypothetical protein [Leptolyngbyaceae cyanobacterium bins.59]
MTSGNTSRQAKASVKYTKENIAKAREFLKDVPKKPQDEFSLHESIYQMKGDINALLKKGYSYEEIAEMLSKLDFNISATTLKQYLSKPPAQKNSRSSNKEDDKKGDTQNNKRKPPGETSSKNNNNNKGNTQNNKRKSPGKNTSNKVSDQVSANTLNQTSGSDEVSTESPSNSEENSTEINTNLGVNSVTNNSDSGVQNNIETNKVSDIDEPQKIVESEAVPAPKSGKRKFGQYATSN